ncbi:hypothetical protein BDZ89DRAFT_1160105 [Hymenopellis radicata]|nr:hypothetical protein BDZ89DRAFT_1160105 [Hymenopellis radicata]
MALNDNDAALVGSYASTFFFGIYLVIAVECSKLLYQRYKTGRGHKYLATTHVLLLVFISTRCLATAERAMNAYKYSNVSRGVIAMGGYSSPMGLLVCILFVLVVLIYDAFLIFRTFVVWNNGFIVIVIPVLAALADLGSGTWWIYLNATFLEVRGLPTNLVTALTVFSSLTAFVNVFCTGLIAYRILGVKTRSKGLKRDDSFTRIVALVVESAVATCIVSLCIIITLVVRSFSCYIFSDISAPTIGIVFCSIVIRVSQGRSHGDPTRASSNEIRWNSSENEDPETAASSGNVPIHLESVVHSENSREYQNFNRSTLKLARVPPPELPVFETTIIKGEAY